MCICLCVFLSLSVSAGFILFQTMRGQMTPGQMTLVTEREGLETWIRAAQS